MYLFVYNAVVLLPL